MIGLLIILLFALNFIWTSYQEKREGEKALQDYEQQIKYELESIHEILKADPKVDISHWEERNFEKLSIGLKAPPEFRVSKLLEYQTNSSGYLTLLDEESEKSVFLPENQKQESEPLSPVQYGIVIKKYLNQTGLDDWFSQVYTPEFFPEDQGIVKEFIPQKDKKILLIYDQSGDLPHISAAVEKNNEIIFFITYIGPTGLENIQKEVEKFKVIILTLDL